MSTEIVTELVLEKQRLVTVNQQLIAVLGAIVMSNGKTEYRLTKAALNKTIKKQVIVRGLKTGGMVVTVKDTD